MANSGCEATTKRPVATETMAEIIKHVSEVEHFTAEIVSKFGVTPLMANADECPADPSKKPMHPCLFSQLEAVRGRLGIVHTELARISAAIGEY